MPSLPSGTVSFIFTDIESSTRLLHVLGNEKYSEVLAAQRRLLRSAFQSRGGTEIDAQGDTLFAAFVRAKDAVEAAVAAQRAMAAHPWPGGATVRVRMGLHTGEPMHAETGYVGMDVHRAARICSAGHGGQILLSQTTRDLVEDDLPEGTTLLDLGEHRLKDLARPQRLYQLWVADLPGTFPPLKSLDVALNNLPVQLTTFIGRKAEEAEVRRLLFASRLLTLTGAGGVGKTRLALQVAAELLDGFKDGTWFVDLAALANSALVPHAVASSLEVREQAGRAILPTLIDALRPKDLLLILDNCEHLVAACASLAAALLRACRELHIMATSREALRVEGEVVYAVPPLSLPDLDHGPPLDALKQSEAARLFVERASRAVPNFQLTGQSAAAVVQVCRRLDGVPLALELAAARANVLSVQQIAGRLDKQFQLLTVGSRTAPARHQTLQAALDWSYALLSEREQILLRRLSVFAGGCTLEATEAVCASEGLSGPDLLDLLAGLVEKSLVLPETHHADPRYRLLEPIRQYSRDKLVDRAEETQVRARHRDFFLALAEEAADHLRGPEPKPWLDRLETELDNLRAALEWSRTTEGGDEGPLRFIHALTPFWNGRGYVFEGRYWAEDALSRDRGASQLARARALVAAAFFAYRQDDYERMARAASESLAIFRELGDKHAMVAPLRLLGTVAVQHRDYEQAEGLYEEALGLARELGDSRLIALSLWSAAHGALSQGHLDQAAALYEEAMTLHRQIGDKSGIGRALCGLGIVAMYRHKHDQAEALCAESLAVFRQAGDKMNEAVALLSLGAVAQRRGEYKQALARYRESAILFRQWGDRLGMVDCLEELAGISCAQSQPQRAARLFAAAQAQRDVLRVSVPPVDRAEYEHNVARVRALLGEEAFATAWSEGRAMTLEEAVEYALAEDGPQETSQ